MNSVALILAMAMAMAPVLIAAMDGGPRGFYTRVSKQDILARKSLEVEKYPEGYYAFNVSPHKVPPKVRKPPYAKSGRPCPGVMGVPNPQGLENLCGNLNTGFLPPNPMGHNFEDDSPYPFELIRNKTLDFFSKALPILKDDETLPKVDVYGQFSKNPELQYQVRRKRATEEKLEVKPDAAAEEKPEAEKPEEKSPVKEEQPQEEPAVKEETPEEKSANTEEPTTVADEETATDPSTVETSEDSTNSSSDEEVQQSPRQGRALCDSDSANFLCKMYKSVRGSEDKVSNKRNNNAGGRRWSERADDEDFPGGNRGNNRNRFNGVNQPPSGPAPGHEQEGPATPCPTTVEYVTPIFARNYQGVWRYIVQIPYEGYFTQTVEVTKCMNKKCAMIEGACLAAPRWVSLLVAEMFYPDGGDGGSVEAPSAGPQPPQGPVFNPQRYRGSRSLDSAPEAQGTAPHQVVDGASSHVDDQQAVARRKRNTDSDYCDGHDEKGCYQVRMYYDWFLASGSCKCWRQTFADYLGTKK